MTMKREEMKMRLRSVDPYEFEDLVADVWDADGWETTVSQDSQDMGVDIEAWDRDGIVNQKAVIQAKRYSKGNKIGRPKIQQYHSLKEQDSEADVAVVVTTSSFASTAEDWANEHNVKLVDGDDLVDRITDLGLTHLVEKYAPPIDEIQSDDGETGTTKSEPTTSSDSSEQSRKVLPIAAGAIMQVGGFADVVSPTLIPALSVNASAAMMVLGVLLGTIGVVADQRALGRGIAATAIRGVLALFLGVLYLAYYLIAD